MPESTVRENLKREFNRWAEEGRGEEMESHHLPIVEPTLELMNIQPADRILDLGCGTGWLVRKIASMVTEGEVVGVDVSDEMIRRAQTASAGLPRVAFLQGIAERIPSTDGRFTKVISVESAYYWPEPAQGLREIFRVLAPGSSAWILINYYRDNPYCHQWGAHFNTPAHLLSAEEWADKFRTAGFAGVAHQRIPDNSPTPEVYTGRWFRDADELKNFKREGALLVHGV
ncbi:MAG: class I SAM-dependent methyltransferase [Terriglobia bacterium]